jgi:erythromycin esterase-like protein
VLAGAGTIQAREGAMGRDDGAVAAVRAAAVPLQGPGGSWDPLLEAAGDARLVLLGEATHGTHEFYRARAEITRRLVTERGFAAIAVEADWPDAWRAGAWACGMDHDGDAGTALGGFRRFPRWMWRNDETARLLRWLRAHNASVGDPDRRVGFYGLDLYSLFTSIEAVVHHLERVDPAAAERARSRYGCFDRAGGDPQAYGYAAELGMSEACHDEVVRQLQELRDARAGSRPSSDLFHAEQNARLVKNAEEYYRSMFSPGISSWNLRDCHMADTLDALAAHLEDRGVAPKIVVWEHNSHVGDARATEMGERGEWTVGRLARERHGDDPFLVGFTTHHGSVTAASDWGEPAERKRVRPALPGSVEALFHETGIGSFFLALDRGEGAGALLEPRLERAIGVIYRPETERGSHYFLASVAGQFDAVVHFDRTHALHPLERTPAWVGGEPGQGLDPPETFPTGL